MLIVSHLTDDFELAQKLTWFGDFHLKIAKEPDKVRDFLVAHPHATVLWNANVLTAYDSVYQVLRQHCRPRNLVAITSQSLHEYPDLLRFQFFNHHWTRRSARRAPELLAKLVMAIQSQNLHQGSTRGYCGIVPYLSRGAAVRRIELTRSSHKNAAVEAVQKHLTNLGIAPRLASLVARSVDELILNAIFDAPVGPSERRLSPELDHSLPISLHGQSAVELQIGTAGDYFVISVSDRFGSLSREAIVDSLGKHYQRKQFYGGKGTVSDTEPGMGLRGIFKSGLSMIFALERTHQTEVMILFPKAKTYRDFKRGFQLLSVFGE